MRRSHLLPIAFAAAAAACATARPAAPPEPLTPAPEHRTAGGAARPAPSIRSLDARAAGSSVALADFDHTRATLVADEEGRALRVVSLDAGARELARVAFEARPSQLAVAPDGRVFVALRDAAMVAVLARGPAGLREIARVPVGGDPRAVALTPDGASLLVAASAPPEIDRVDTASLAVVARGPLPRSPRAIAVAADGKTAVVAHATGSRASVVDVATARADARSLDAVRDDLPEHGALPFLQATTVARAGDRFFVPGVLAATGDTSVATKDGYGHLSIMHIAAETFHLAQIDARGGASIVDDARVAAAGALPDSCLLPRAAVADGDRVYVACTGPGRLFAVDLAEGDGAWTAPVHVPDGITGLALDARAGEIVAWSADAHALVVLPIAAPVRAEDAHLAAGGPAVEAVDGAARPLEDLAPLAPEVARGRALFHATNDPALSRDGRACASCHVDGLEDGLTWPTPEGPRQTPALAGRIAGTAPYGWSGTRATLADNLAETVHRLGGTGLEGADRDALLAYLAAMPAPARARPDDPSTLARGRAIFESREAGCGGCHAGRALADRLAHDVKSRATGDQRDAFDTPSLASIARTAPYFHDGRYPTLRALLDGADGTMGHTRQLSPADEDALLAYLGSL